MLRTAGKKAPCGNGPALQQAVEPFFAAIGPLVLCEPALHGLEFRQPGDPFAEPLFCGVGEVALTIGAFALAVLETEVEHAPRLEACPQAGEGGGQLGCGYVKEAGAGPDAVIATMRRNVLKAAHVDRLADVRLGKAGEFGRSVKCLHPKTSVKKRPAVAPRAAAGVQDQPAGWDAGEEMGVEGGHVHVQRVFEEAGGITIVMAYGAGDVHGHGWRE